MSNICLGKLCQIEIHVRDLEKSLQFYLSVFGWQRIPADLHDYIVLDVPENCPYGVSLIPTAPSSRTAGANTNRIVLYFACHEPEECANKALAAGGRKRLGPKRVPGVGTIYLIEDLDGHRFGLYRTNEPKGL